MPRAIATSRRAARALPCPAKARRRSRRLIVGGPEAVSACMGDFEAMCGAEFAICGEGEASFSEFVRLKLDRVKKGFSKNGRGLSYSTTLREIAGALEFRRSWSAPALWSFGNRGDSATIWQTDSYRK